MTSREKPAMQNFTSLLSFIKGDSRIPDAYRWGNSINVKVHALKILYEEVLSQIPKCSKVVEAIEKDGFGGYVQLQILATKYECFLNSIYALCENLSYVVHHLFDKSVPRHFRKQKIRFLAVNDIDSHYSKLLEKTSWYDEVHGMRTEATHLLSGMITIPSPSKLGYFNLPRSQRKDKPENIQVDDVGKHVKEVYQSVLTFLSDFGNHFIKIINQDCHVSQICFIFKGRVFAKKISLREYLNSQAGICQTTAIDCPRMNSCEARKK